MYKWNSRSGDLSQLDSEWLSLTHFPPLTQNTMNELLRKRSYNEVTSNYSKSSFCGLPKELSAIARITVRLILGHFL